MWYSENIRMFAIAKPFKYDGISYPATVFRNPDALKLLTIYPVVIVKPDSKYYTMGAETKVLANDVWTFTYAAVEKDLETLRGELVRHYLNLLDTTLSRTDKFLTRADEMETWFSKWTINPALQEWRDGVYLLFNVRMNSITEAVTFEGLMLADEQAFDIPAQPEPYQVETE